jgi:hypothetical protein
MFFLSLWYSIFTELIKYINEIEKMHNCHINNTINISTIINIIFSSSEYIDKKFGKRSNSNDINIGNINSCPRIIGNEISVEP